MGGGLIYLSSFGQPGFAIGKAHAEELSPVGNNNVVSQIDVAKKALATVAPAITADQSEANVQANLPDGYIEKPLVAETKVTPPVVVVPPAPAIKPATTPVTTKKKIVVLDNNVQKVQVIDSVVGNVFPYGYCTYYVAQRRVVTWRGNAGTWLSGAQAQGYATGGTPKVGAIMVTAEGSSAGHVAYVEKVDGNMITVSEMNYRGFGVISTRTLSASSSFIKGFIY